MYVWASGGHRPPRVLTNSRRTASQTGSPSISTPSRSKPESTESGLHLGRGTSERGVVSCARSVTHRRVRALACSSPPTAHLAPHPNLRRPIGGSGLRGDRALRSTDRALRSNAFEQSLQALVIVDRESTVVGLNHAAERLTGWNRAEATGRPAADVLEVRTETGVNLCAANGPLRRALRQGKAVDTHFAYLFRFRTSDEPVRVSYSVAPIRDGNDVAAVLVAIHDVTPELEIIQAKDALMLAASHELKTPVTTLKGLSELLLDFDLTEPQRRELLQDLHGQVNRME